jgi:hypothetical protein
MERFKAFTNTRRKMEMALDDFACAMGNDAETIYSKRTAPNPAKVGEFLSHMGCTLEDMSDFRCEHHAERPDGLRTFMDLTMWLLHAFMKEKLEGHHVNAQDRALAIQRIRHHYDARGSIAMRMNLAAKVMVYVLDDEREDYDATQSIRQTLYCLGSEYENKLVIKKPNAVLIGALFVLKFRHSEEVTRLCTAYRNDHRDRPPTHVYAPMFHDKSLDQLPVVPLAPGDLQPPYHFFDPGELEPVLPRGRISGSFRWFDDKVYVTFMNEFGRFPATRTPMKKVTIRGIQGETKDWIQPHVCIRVHYGGDAFLRVMSSSRIDCEDDELIYPVVDKTRDYATSRVRD